MVDKPDRVTPRFPPHLERLVQHAITERLKQLDVGFGYSSASCGSDIIFLESVLEINGEINIILPYEKMQFANDSVDIIPGSNWEDRYYRLLDQATQVLTASEYRLEEGSVFYDYASLLLYGLAKKRAKQLETELVPIAVWNERQGDGPGGTETNVKRWSRYGNNIELFNPTMIRNGQPLQVRIYPGEITNQLHDNKPELPAEFTMQIMAILFADVVKFTKLTEKEITLFVQNFLGSIADMIASSSHVPEIKNTWGDAIYFVFSNSLMK